MRDWILRKGDLQSIKAFRSEGRIISRGGGASSNVFSFELKVSLFGSRLGLYSDSLVVIFVVIILLLKTGKIIVQPVECYHNYSNVV